MQTIRVLIADDHPTIIEGLVGALKDGDIERVGIAHSAVGVFAAYEESKPDVVLMDIRFGSGPTGLNVAVDLIERYPGAKVVFFSQFDQDELIRDAYRIGAFCFVPKYCSPEVVADVIRQVHAGKTHFLPEISDRLARAGLNRTDSPLAKLDSRELQVFGMMAQGQTNSEIAEVIGLSSRTVSFISQTIKDKLGVHRAADITRLAVRHQLIEP